MHHPLELEPDRLASSIFLFAPEEALEFALDFLNGALLAQDREGAKTWAAILNRIERMQLEEAVDQMREMRPSSMM